MTNALLRVQARIGFSVMVSLLGLLGLTSSARAEPYQLQPIVTRYAKTADKIFADVTVKYFQDVELQEADHFDGWGVNLDVTVPFRHDMQLYLLLPVYTDGKARLKSTGEDVDVDGNGGVFDFATLFFEHQLMDESESGFNLGYYLGYGYRTDKLKTSGADIINHRGQVAQLGLRFDQPLLQDEVRFLGNLGARYYFDTDDLNPASETNDTFWMYEGNAAAVFAPWGGLVYPAAELLLRGIDTDYLSLSLLPEVIFPLSSHLELKLGGLVGLTDDGEDLGANFQLTGRF